MRLPSIPTLLRTFYAFTNTTTRLSSPASSATLLLHQRPLLYKSMPTIPLLSSLFSTSQSSKMTTEYPNKRTNDEWRAILSPEQFRVLRKQGTEMPGSGEYDKHHPEQGVYSCAACHAPLYKASHKFKSGCGWPAYFDSIPGAVTRHEDATLGMVRTEIVCSNCGGHLGHVFKGEGYQTPTDERHCVNSVSLRFAEDEGSGAGREDGGGRESKA
ncbi:MAG: hypothetical protein Q9227_002092 [Pyrenula ochraceoflavens]